MAVQIQLRRDIAANWTSLNPILAEGEFGLELDTIKKKLGNGVDAWNDLAYYANPEGGGGDDMAVTTGTLDQFADVTQALGATLAVDESTTLSGGNHSGTNTGDQDLSGLASDAELTAHAAATSGVHGISPAAATVLDDETVTAMRATLGAVAEVDSPVFANLGDAAGNTATIYALYIRGLALCKAPIIVVGEGNNVYLNQSGDGVLSLAGVGNADAFNRLNFGYPTSSNPAIKRDGSNLQARLADDSGYTSISVLNLIATGTVRFPSYTAAAALALVGMVEGDTIYVSNDPGGPTLALYNGAVWVRQTDLAPIEDSA